MTAIQVYNETVHWNAVHNGEMKFIFHAFWPTGDVRQMQLFNLTADPHELRDLARSNEAADRAEIDKWYQVMAQQFLAEGRDKYGFVTANGTLLQRTEGMTMSPNYPHHAPHAWYRERKKRRVVELDAEELLGAGQWHPMHSSAALLLEEVRDLLCGRQREHAVTAHHRRHRHHSGRQHQCHHGQHVSRT